MERRIKEMNPISNIAIFHNQNYRLPSNSQHIRKRSGNGTTKQGSQVSVLNSISNTAQKQIVGIGVYPAYLVKEAKKRTLLVAPLEKTAEYLEEDFSQSYR